MLIPLWHSDGIEAITVAVLQGKWHRGGGSSCGFAAAVADDIAACVVAKTATAQGVCATGAGDAVQTVAGATDAIRFGVKLGPGLSGRVLAFHDARGAVAYIVVAVGNAPVFSGDVGKPCQKIVFVHFVLLGMIYTAHGADVAVAEEAHFHFRPHLLKKTDTFKIIVVIATV